MSELKLGQVKPSKLSNPSTGITQFLKQYKEKMGTLLDLSESQMNRLKKRLKKEIKDWKSDTTELHDRLEKYHDALEGIIRDSNPPFEGASDIHIPVVSIYAKIYHSIEVRSLLGSDNIWYMQTRKEELQDQIASIDEGINFKARTEWNCREVFSDVFAVTNRDSLGLIQWDYVIETEKVQDVIFIAGKEDFMREFPSPQESGLDEKEWKELALESMLNASEETPLEVPIEYEEIKYRGPQGTVVEYADAVILPAHAKSLKRKDCRGYGKRFSLRRAEIRRKMESGEWDEDECKKVLENRNKEADISSWEKAKDFAQGLNRTGKPDEHEFYELIYWFSLEKDEDDVKLVCTYSEKSDALVCYKLYPYKVDTYVPFRIERRANRLAGGSLVGDLIDQNDEIDAQHSQRINSRKISEVPSFKAKKPSAKDFDPSISENKWKPGVIFWLEDPQAFDQFRVQPADFRTSIVEEQNSLKYCSLIAGVEPFTASGSAQAGDASAPGNKTAMLITQANMRMEDPIAELRVGVEESGKVCLALEYQFGPMFLEFQAKQDGNTVEKSIHKRFMRTGIEVFAHGTTVVYNPEAEFMKAFNYYKALMVEPLFAQSPKRRIELLRQALMSGRIKNTDKIMPPAEEIEAEEVKTKVKAMLMIAAQQKKQQDIQKKDTLKRLKNEVSAHKVMGKVQDNTLDQNNPVPLNGI